MTTLTRKDFLALASLAAAGMFIPGCTKTPSGYTVKSGAGLLINPEDVPRIRQVFLNEPLFAKMREKLSGKSDQSTVSTGGQDTRMGISASSEIIDREMARDFLRNKVRLNDQLYDIVIVGDLIENMSFYYLMTGDEDAATLAIEALDTLMRFEKWDYFLDGGVQTIGFQRAPSSTKATVLGIQWLAERLPAEKRREYLTTMASQGLEPCYWSTYGMRNKDKVRGWGFDSTSTYLEHRPGDKTLDFTNWPTILDGNNLKAVPANSLLQGALVYMQEFGESEDTKRWIEQALYSYGTLNTVFEEDGSYDEGAAYSTYTAIQMAEVETVLINMMDKKDQGLVNWQGYGDYLIHMTMPTHETTTTIVNFGDNWRAGNSSIAFFVASRYDHAPSQWLGRERYTNHDTRSVIWYEPALAPAPPPQEPSIWNCDLDWVIMRSGFELEDLVVALRSGPPSNHEHADRNSFLMACYGEQLIADPEKAPYNFKDPSWMMRTTAGHNAVLINGMPHQYHDGSEGTNASDASAKVLSYGNKDGVLHVASDASPAYQLVDSNIDKVLRCMYVLPEMMTTVILDRVDMKAGNPATFEARFFAYNMDGNGKITKTNNGFKTTRPMAYVDASFKGSAAVSNGVNVLPIAPERQADYPFAHANMPSAEQNWLVSTICAGTKDAPAAVSDIAVNDTGEVIVTIRRNGTQLSLSLTPTAQDPSSFTITRS